MADDQLLPPPCPRPDKFVHGPPARTYRSHHKVQPLSRPNTVAALTPAEEAQFSSVEVELGGRQKLAALLAAADVPDRDRSLAARLVDPANDHLSLAQLCAFERISLRRLLDFIKDAALISGQVRALVTVGDRLPDVAASLMTDAVGGDRTCSVCRGLYDEQLQLAEVADREPFP